MHPVAEAVLPDVQPRSVLVKLHGVPTQVVHVTDRLKEPSMLFSQS